MGSDVAQRGGQADNAQVRFFLLPLHTPLQFLAPASIQILDFSFITSAAMFLKPSRTLIGSSCFYSLLDMILNFMFKVVQRHLKDVIQSQVIVRRRSPRNLIVGNEG